MRSISPQTRSYIRSVGIGVLVWYFVFRPLLVIALELPGPWGPPLNTSVQEGWQLQLKCRRFGRETDEILFVTSPAGHRQEFVVNGHHALDVWYATIRRSDPPDCRVWIESRGEVIASIDLQTMEFWSEANQQPFWAQAGQGKILSHGPTRYWWEILLPM